MNVVAIVIVVVILLVILWILLGILPLLLDEWLDVIERIRWMKEERERERKDE